MGPEYVPLVLRSHDLWREIEQEAGVQLLTRSGGLVLAQADSPFLSRTRASARRYEIAHEDLRRGLQWLDAREPDVGMMRG